MTPQWCAVPDQPEMSERVKEYALPMRPPRHRMVPHRVVIFGPRRGGPLSEPVRIIHKNFHPYGRRPGRDRAVPPVVGRLSEKEGRPLNLEPDHRPQIPELHGP